LTKENPTAPKRFLVVEDDKESCELLRHVLTEWELVISDTIAGAVSHYLDNHFDLFMLDNWLPDGSGIELCREVRMRFPHSPIVLMSASAHESTIEEAASAGADRYFVKPFDPFDLKETVKELLEKKPRREGE
jgi:DNA-binding response OmpR family regulator